MCQGLLSEPGSQAQGEVVHAAEELKELDGAGLRSPKP